MATISTEGMKEMYEVMYTSRYWEECMQEEYLVGKQPHFDIGGGPIPGELHLSLGQEAAAAGVCQHLRDDDTVTAPHRPHHTAIAKGVDLKKMTAEIMGKEAGLGKGKGGHMHLFDPDVNFACSGIIAQGCPPATGAALAAKKRNTDNVAVAFLGEGAIDQGGFFESLNFASIHDLPVIFVIEDNDWAISMPKELVTDVEDGSQRAAGFDIPGVRVNEDDAVKIYEAAGEAVGRARDRNGPTLMEVQVHRQGGHFVGDHEPYRPEADKEAAQARDSIPRLAEDLMARGVDESTLEDIRSRAEDRADEAIEWAKEHPKPEPEAAYEDMFVNPPSGVTDTEPTFEVAGGDD